MRNTILRTFLLIPEALTYFLGKMLHPVPFYDVKPKYYAPDCDQGRFPILGRARRNERIWVRIEGIGILNIINKKMT